MMQSAATGGTWGLRLCFSNDPCLIIFCIEPQSVCCKILASRGPVPSSRSWSVVLDALEPCALLMHAKKSVRLGDTCVMKVVVTKML